jgi:hypothetical protein
VTYDVQEHLKPRGLTGISDGFLRLDLTEQERNDLIQHLPGSDPGPWEAVPRERFA